MQIGRLKTTEGENCYQSTKDRDKFRKPVPLSQKREESSELDTASRYVQFTRPSLFAKVGLICETIDRDEERDGKQREIVKKTNIRRLRVYYLYTMPHICFCIESIVTVVYTLFKFIFQRACG